MTHGLSSPRPGRLRMVPALSVLLALSLPGVLSAQAGADAIAGADAVAGERRLRLLAAVELDDLGFFRTRASAFLQATGFIDSIPRVRSALQAHCCSSTQQGMDPKRPLRVFYLADGNGSLQTTRVSMIPVVGRGKPFLDAIRFDYQEVQTSGAVTTAEYPKHEALPPIVFFAATGPNIIASQDYDAVRWVAGRIRNRDLPVVAPSSLPLRISIVPETLADALEALRDSPALEKKLRTGTMEALRGHLGSTAGIVRPLRSIDLALSAGAAGLDIEAAVLGTPGSPFSRAVHSLPPPAPGLDTSLPGKVFLLRHDSFPNFLQMAGDEYLDWADLLADSWGILGFRIGPLQRKWMDGILPKLAGDRLEALVSPPGLEGIVHLQSFPVKDPEAMAEMLSERVASFRAAADFPGTVCDDFDACGHTAHRILLARAGTGSGDPPADGRFDLDAVIDHLSKKTHLEMAVAGNLLVLVQGPEGSLEALLPALVARKRSGDTARRAKSILVSSASDAAFEPGGASVYAPSAYIRALAALAPDMAERQIAILQVGGDGYAVSQTTSPGRIRWNARLTTLEASTLHRIFSTQSKLLQDIVLQVVLEPLKARQRDAPSSDDILSTLPE